MDQGQKRGDVPSFGSTLWAGIAGRCPSCHRGKLYSGYLTLAPKCDVCGLDYSFADSGDGPAVFVILVTGFVVTGLALFTEMRYAPSYWLLAAFAVLIGLGVWQLQRLHWKQGLIAEIETRSKGEPIALDQAIAIAREG